MNFIDFMNFITSVWQHLLETLDPIAFTVGFFSVYWYAVFFIGGFAAVFLLALWYARHRQAPVSEEDVFDLCILLFFGAVAGGRIGYVLFYNLDKYLADPLLIFSPYDFGQGVWVGISGMSYHGGLLGVIIALLWFAYKKQVSFWEIADFVAYLSPIAVFFGRLGNFFNLELYGRITDRQWGMIFPGVEPVGVLRHPSTVYEAFLEGILLFVILHFLRRKKIFPGAITCGYLALYAIFRFVGEFFREPDPQLGYFLGTHMGGFTLGQLLSVAMFLAAGVIFLWLKREKYGTIM